MSRLIIENTILPEFRRKDFPAGIKLGVRDIKETLLGDGEEVKRRATGIDNHDADYIMLAIICFWIAIVVYGMYQQYRYAQYLKKNPQAARRARMGRSAGTWGGPPIIIGGSGSSGGGGGFSGGGGDFGGGGSSGSW